MGTFIEEQSEENYFYCGKIRYPKKLILGLIFQIFDDLQEKTLHISDIANELSKKLRINKISVNSLRGLLGNNPQVYKEGILRMLLNLERDPTQNSTAINKTSATQTEMKIAKPDNELIEDIDYYYCTKTVRFPLKDVVNAIYKKFTTSNASSLNIEEVYNFLSKDFGVKSFNRANLIELLQTKNMVPITTVKELYLKYNFQEKQGLNSLKILEYIFIDNREIIKNCFKVMGLELITLLIDKGIHPFIGYCNAIILHFDSDAKTLELKDKRRYKILDKDSSKIVLEFMGRFSEDEIISILDDEEKTRNVVNTFTEEKKLEEDKLRFKKSIQNLVEMAHSDNKDAKTHFIFNTTVGDILSKSKLHTINDLASVSKSTAIALYQYKDYILDTLKRLQHSLPAYLNERFKQVIMYVNKDYKPNSQWERFAAILEKRADGFNLPETGNLFGITREAVRQVDKKYLARFSEFYNSGRGNLTSLLRAFANNPYFISNNDIERIFPFNAKLFKYLLQSTEIEDLSYIEEIDKFYFVEENDWYRELILFAENMPTEFATNQVDKYVNEALNTIDNTELQLDYADCEKIIMQNYKLLGTLYAKSKTTLTERFRNILKTNFDRPVNIYDEEFLNQFRKIYQEQYADDIKSDHAITAILAKVGMLVGKGLYVINDREFITKDLADKIYNYIIESGREIFLTNNLYSIFETELMAQGIDNKYFMQGALKQRLEGKIFFSRDYISTKKEVTNFYKEIYNFVKNEDRLVTYSEVQEAFIGTPWNVLMLGLSQNGIINMRSKYIHIDSLHINDDDKAYLKATIENLVNDGGIHHSTDLLTYIRLTNKNLLNKAQIEDQFGLFSLAAALFENEFEFKRPFIAKKGTEIGNQYERINEFVNSQEELGIDDLLDFVRDNKLGLYSICEYIDSLQDYVFKDENRIQTIEKSNINKYNTEVAEKIILKTMGTEEFIFADTLKIYSFLPKEVSWTPWLLYSALNKCGTKLKAIPSNTKFRHNNVMYARLLIIYREIPAKNINEFLDYLKKKLDTTDEEFYKYLKAKGLS